jgi:hypothetical protein
MSMSQLYEEIINRQIKLIETLTKELEQYELTKRDIMDYEQAHQILTCWLRSLSICDDISVYDKNEKIDYKTVNPVGTRLEIVKIYRCGSSYYHQRYSSPPNDDVIHAIKRLGVEFELIEKKRYVDYIMGN